LLVLLNQRGQVLTPVEAVLVVAAILAASQAALTLAVAISAVVALVQRQLSPVVAHVSAERALVAYAAAVSGARRAFTRVALASPKSGRACSPGQRADQEIYLLAESQP
jgi:hypothetical protein